MDVLDEKLSRIKFSKESHSRNFRAAVDFPKMLADVISYFRRHVRSQKEWSVTKGCGDISPKKPPPAIKLNF